MPSSLDGDSITVKITYSSVNQGEINDLEKRLPPGVLIMNLPDGTDYHLIVPNKNITHEDAIDFLRAEGWLQAHDRELTPLNCKDCCFCKRSETLARNTCVLHESRCDDNDFCSWAVKREGNVHG